MKWPKKHTKNLIYKVLINTSPKTEEQLINAAITLAVKKKFYEFDSENDQEASFADLDSKEQSHFVEVVKEVVKDLTEKEMLKVNPDTTVSLTADGIYYVLNRLPKNYF